MGKLREKTAYFRFQGLAGSLIKRGLFTRAEIGVMVDKAKADGTPNDIWQTALSELIPEANLRLANRGSDKYGSHRG